MSDPAILVALVGVITTLITTLGVVFVAVINNRRERSNAAEEGIEATLRERILLRDERIIDLKNQVDSLRNDKERLQLQSDDQLETIEENLLLIRHLRRQIESLTTDQES